MIGSGDGDGNTADDTTDSGMSGKTITTTNSMISSLDIIDAELDIENKKTFIDGLIWNHRIQDFGCELKKLKAKIYWRNKIMGVGLEDNKLFYFDLTAITVDLSKNTRDPLILKGWSKLPKNQTQVKEK